MNLDSVLSGKFPIELKSLPDLVLVVPKGGAITRLSPIINKNVEEFRKRNAQQLTGYSALQAEKDLLSEFPDYYEVIEKANEKKQEILLSLSEKDTPDERFLKTPDEVVKLQGKELEDYNEYYKKQFSKLEKLYMEDPLIVKSMEYKKRYEELYLSTDDAFLNKIRKIFWLVFTAENSKGEPYFKDKEKGFETIMSLNYTEYSILMEMWEGVIDGFGLPF